VKRGLNLKVKNKAKFYFLTPISGTESELRMTLGAKASGFRDSICWRV